MPETSQPLKRIVSATASLYLTAFWIIFCFSVVTLGSPLFASADTMVVVGTIRFEGNRVTRESILKRELTVHSGEKWGKNTLDQALNNSRQNLLNTGLFNFVELKTSQSDSASNYVNVLFRLTERWYIWPLPVFEIADRNINAWWESGAFKRINYGVLIQHNNMRGRMEKMTIAALSGHEKMLSLVYDIPYIDKRQLWGVRGEINYTTTHELLYGASMNEPLWYKSTGSVLKEQWSMGVGIKYRPDYLNYHQIGFYYYSIHLNDSVLALNPEYSGKRNLLDASFTALKYFYKSDHRDQHYYPLNGHYLDLNIEIGGSVQEEGGISAFSNLSSNLRMFKSLSTRLYTAAGITAFYSFPGQSPFMFHQGLGFGRNFVRAYEDYIIPLDEFVLLKSNLKYAILPQKELHLPLIPGEQFNRMHIAIYLSSFIDAAYVGRQKPAENEKYYGEWIIGYGLGLDFVTYYDKVIRIEYSFQRSGDSGLYIHVIAPI